MAWRFIEESTSGNESRVFDWWGAITLGVALSSLVLVLDRGMDWGWFSLSSLLCYVMIVIFTAIFIRIEKAHPEPIVDFKFFKIPVFVSTMINNFIVFMGMMGGIFLIPVFTQTFLGYDAQESGYLFMPMAFAMMLASPIGGYFIDKVESRYVIMFSTFVAAIGLYLFSYLDPRS